MKLKFEQYKDKVMGCWAGKNIGGVLGAPFEGMRQINDIEFYTQDLSMGPPPNDDLDLQIVWLAAVERYGRSVDAAILGEYWMSFIIPNWVEYGMGKANMRAGLQPPLSGEVDNTYKDSCGCYIRSEIWACLAPGHPEIAARYAYEDAIVDHAGEGMYGEIFFAALQSAAFVEGNTRKLIDIGLSYIPEDCITASAIKKVMECYDNGMSLREARKEIHNTAPGTFGIQGVKLSEINAWDNEGMEVGDPGFDAPENVAFTIAGWLYGNEDFGDCLCKAVAFGEDTDCTCATLGAILGIVKGASNLPRKWMDPLDDKIATLCIDETSHMLWVPQTATELSNRVMRTMPAFLGQDECDIFAEDGMVINCKDGDDLYCRKTEEYLPLINGIGGGKSELLPIRSLCDLSPFVVRQSFPAFHVMVDYNGSVHFKHGANRSIRVTVINVKAMCQQQWARITLYTPAGVEVLGGKSVLLPLNNLHGSQACVEFTFNLDAFEGSKVELIIDTALEGRHSYGDVKVTLMRES